MRASGEGTVVMCGDGGWKSQSSRRWYYVVLHLDWAGGLAGVCVFWKTSKPRERHARGCGESSSRAN
jgi:hypothetical protein